MIDHDFDLGVPPHHVLQLRWYDAGGVQQPARSLTQHGVVPVAPDGTVPGGLAAQAEIVWANIGAILAEAGLGPEDVVSVTTYVVVGQHLAPVMAARDRFLNGRLVASTLVTVPALARPEWRMEVAVVAAR